MTSEPLQTFALLPHPESTPERAIEAAASGWISSQLASTRGGATLAQP